MSEHRKHIIVAGLFVICVFVAGLALSKDESPPLAWTLLLCGMWSCGVWLYPACLTPSKQTFRLILRRLIQAFGIGLVGGAFIVAGMFFLHLGPWEKRPIQERDALMTLRFHEQNSEPSERATRVLSLLSSYRLQQEKMGQPLFPTYSTGENSERKRLYQSFQGLANVPYDAKSDEQRALYANVLFLNWYCPEYHTDRHDYYRDEYAKSHFDQKQGISEVEFYHHAARVMNSRSFQTLEDTLLNFTNKDLPHN